jgi:acetolactate synthase-1/2/3 large subunit
VKLKLDITIVILNDQSYGMIKRKQKNMWLTDFSLDLDNPDFIKLAESFGATAFTVNTPWEFTKYLKESQKITWLKIIEVAITYPEKIA